MIKTAILSSLLFMACSTQALTLKIHLSDLSCVTASDASEADIQQFIQYVNSLEPSRNRFFQVGKTFVAIDKICFFRVEND